jgi:hypothetical protein
MKPSIGRIVHYQSYGTPGGEYLAEPRAAVITALVDGHDHGYVGLAVFNPTGMFFHTEVPFSADPKPGHWSWPPRV